MKVQFDEKGRAARIRIEVPEDLIVLRRLLRGDTVIEAETFRYEERRGDELRAERPPRKKVRVRIRPFKVEYDELGKLRVLGIIQEGVLQGKHHSLTLSPGSELVLIKDRWAKWELEELSAAEALGSSPSVMVAVVDDREVELYLVTSTSAKRVAEDRRYGDEDSLEGMLSRLLKALRGRKEESPLVVAGVGGFGEQAAKFLESRGIRVSRVMKVHHGGGKGLHEALVGGRGGIFRELRQVVEMEAVERLKERLFRGGPVSVGPDEVRSSMLTCAVEELFILDSLLTEYEDLLDMAERCSSKVVIISTKGEPYMFLRSLGGVAATLRF